MFFQLRRKSQNIISKLIPITVIALILIIWQVISNNEIIPKYMLPSPLDVVIAFRDDFPLLMSHAKITLQEGAIGLVIGVLLGILIAIIMDAFEFVHKALYPLIVISQTIPTIAIAPLLVLWFGYEMMPKIILIVLTTFFPVAVGMFDGLRTADTDEMKLMKVMGASKIKIYRYIKFPEAMSHFFAGLRVSVTYAVVGAVISEWLGGYKGLGVYMTRVKKSYAFDKMFAVIFLISAISLILMCLVDILQRFCMPWERVKSEEENIPKQQTAER